MRRCAVSLLVVSISLIVLSCGQQSIPAAGAKVSTQADVAAVSNVIEEWGRLTNANDSENGVPGTGQGTGQELEIRNSNSERPVSTRSGSSRATQRPGTGLWECEI